MNRVVKILMDRDNITEREAVRQIQDCRADIMENPGDWDSAVDIISDHLGLEPDFMDDILHGPLT